MRLPVSTFSTAVSIGVLVLSLCLLPVLQPRQLRTVGIPVLLPPPNAGRVECVGRWLILEVGSGGRVKVNGKELTERELDSALTETYRLQVERLLYVKGEAGADFGDVVRRIDRAVETVDHLRIALVTPSAERDNCALRHEQFDSTRLLGRPRTK